MWGTLPVFSRQLYAAGSDPVTAAAMRVYIAATFFILCFLVRGTFRTVRLRELPFYLIYGLTGVSGTFLFYMMAVNLVSTAMASILLYTGPAFVILFSRLFYREPITKVKLAALLCTFGGCALVVRAYDLTTLSANLLGVTLGLLSGLSFSMVTLLGRRARELHDGWTNTGLMMMFGTIPFLFLRPVWLMPAPTPYQWYGYLGIGLVGSVLAYLAYLKGLESGLDGGVASITATLEPVIATLLCAAVFGDRLDAGQILGIVIVLVGVALPSLPRRRGTACLSGEIPY